VTKTSSKYLTEDFGMNTDYVAEAFHYQLENVSRYEEVNHSLATAAFFMGCTLCV